MVIYPKVEFKFLDPANFSVIEEPSFGNRKIAYVHFLDDHGKRSEFPIAEFIGYKEGIHASILDTVSARIRQRYLVVCEQLETNYHKKFTFEIFNNKLEIYLTEDDASSTPIVSFSIKEANLDTKVWHFMNEYLNPELKAL